VAVALLGLFKMSTGLATKGGRDLFTSGAVLITSTAAGRTLGPFSELRKYAVDGASVCVAVLGFGEQWAALAIVGGIGGDGP